MTLNRRVVSSLTIIFFVIFIGLSWIYLSSQARLKQAEDEALKLIGYDYTVKQVNQFYWTTIDTAYFSVDFVDQDGQERYALVEREGGTIHYFTPQDIISEKDAQAIAVNDTGANKILQTRLGMYQNIPAWEMTIRNDDQTLTYYTINAKDGTMVQRIDNF